MENRGNGEEKTGNIREIVKGVEKNLKWKEKCMKMSRVGAFGVRVRFRQKRGSFGVVSKKRWGLFWCGLPKIGVILQCAKLQFQAKICKFNVRNCLQVIKSLKMLAKRAKICNVYTVCKI